MNRTMKALRLIVAVLALSAAAIYAELNWSTLRWPMILHGPLVNADMIRAHFPFHVINPDWMHASGQELVSRWRAAEFYARSGIVLVGWLICMIFAFRWALRDNAA